MKRIAVGVPDTREVRDLARRAGYFCGEDRTKETDVIRKTRATAENLDPMGKPEQPEPWCQLDPEDALDPWGEFEEPELPTIPMTIGPASSSGAPAYNPMSVEAPGIDTGTSLLAEELNWKT